MYVICLWHVIVNTIYVQEEETVWCLEEALIIMMWIMRYVGTNMLDESDSTHWKNQSILLFDVSLDPCNVSVFLTPQSYHSEVCDNHSLWSVLNNRNKLISASLEKVATCSLSNVGCSFFTQTFFDSWIALYVDENYPLPKNKYDISSSRVRSKHGDGRFNNQTDLKIKFGINASFFV